MSSRITTIPLPGDKLDAWRRLASELTGTRRREFDELNRRHGLTQHRAWIQRRADGRHQLLLLHEGVRAERFLSDLVASSHPFDRWVLERFRQIHGSDLGNPLPSEAAALALDWRSDADASSSRATPPLRTFSPMPSRTPSTPPPLPTARASSAPPSRAPSTPPPLPAARASSMPPPLPPRTTPMPPPRPSSTPPAYATPTPTPAASSSSAGRATPVPMAPPLRARPRGE